MASIHPTAIVEAGAEIADDALIGPYCVIGPEVKIGKGCELLSHVVVSGNTQLGEYNRVSPFAVIGGRTQDLKFKGGSPAYRLGIIIRSESMLRLMRRHRMEILPESVITVCSWRIVMWHTAVTLAVR